jgi:multiple sugar transport system substrate-binding protein
MILGMVLLGVGCAPRSRPLTIAVIEGPESDGLIRLAGRSTDARCRPESPADDDWGPVEVIRFPYYRLLVELENPRRTASFDVVMVDDPWLPRLAKEKLLAPLEMPPHADFVGTCLSVSKYPYDTGTLYALPYVGNSQLFCYRTDLLANANLTPPTTWEAVLKAADKILNQKTSYGYVMRAAPGNAVVTDFMPLLWAYGGDVLDKAREVSIVSSKEAKQALHMMLELSKYAPQNYSALDAREVNEYLAPTVRGRPAAMAINWNSWILKLNNDNAKIETIPDLMPAGSVKGVPELGCWLLAVPAASDNASRARKFLSFVTNRQQQKITACWGTPPVERSLFDDADLTKQYASLPELKKALEAARPRPRTPLWPEIEIALGHYLAMANSGGLSADDALERADGEIKGILAKNAKAAK